MNSLNTTQCEPAGRCGPEPRALRRRHLSGPRSWHRKNRSPRASGGPAESEDQGWGSPGTLGNCIFSGAKSLCREVKGSEARNWGRTGPRTVTSLVYLTWESNFPFLPSFLSFFFSLPSCPSPSLSPFLCFFFTFSSAFRKPVPKIT